MSHDQKADVLVRKLDMTDYYTWTLDGINALLPTLSSSARPMTMDELGRMLGSQTQTFIAQCDGKMVGMASLITNYQPVGIVCHVEDVVVDPIMQGRSVGEQIMRELIAHLPEGWRQLDLTSNPERESAHRLYKRLGFTLRETGNYRLKPEQLTMAA